jgi:hypothetical protein
MENKISYGDIKKSLWMRGELSYKLDGLQRSISRTVNMTHARKICILSSRQIGKTYWACVHALMYLLRNPNKIARVIAPTYTQCHDLVNDNLQSIIADAPEGIIWPVKSEYRYNLWNGSSLRLGALERAYVDGNRGGNASLIIYEECGFVKGDDFSYGVDSVLGPQLLRSKGCEIFVSSPSEEPDHPLHTRILSEAEELGTLFQYTVYDSPSITPAQIDEAKRRCGGEHTDAWKREYLAKIIRVMSKVVIPSFDPNRHVKEFFLPRDAYHHLTIDWGGVRDLTVALWHTYNYAQNKLLIWDEKVFFRNTPTYQILKSLEEWDVEWHAKTADVPGQTLVDIHDMIGSDWNLPPKSDWLAGVQSMSNLFELDQIEIHPRCKFLIKSIRGGVFNKNRTDFERFEGPEGIGHCDALAALSYANRVHLRENPYKNKYLQGAEHFFIMPGKNIDQKEGAEEMMGSQTFGKAKQFGKFRNS